MKIYPFILLLLCGIYSNNAFCYGGHGGGHGGGHCGGHGGHCASHGGSHAHYSGHSHICTHYSYHTGRYGQTSWQNDFIPLKGVVETNASTGEGTALQLDPAVTTSLPAYIGNLKYYLGRSTSLDVSLGTQIFGGRDTCKCISTPSTATPSSIFDFRTRAITVAAGFTQQYGDHGPWQYYCGSMLGVSVLYEGDHYMDNTDTSVTNIKFNGQLTLLGVRYGHSLGAYVEIGYGFKGLICGGLSYQAGWRRARRYS